MILGEGLHAYSGCFRELDDAITALRGPGAPPVCLNAHVFPHLVPEGAIVYNLENVPGQVGPRGFEGRELWDFSRRNVSRWERPARYVPIGFHPTMRRFEPLPWEERTVDVVFTGSMNPRRSSLLDDLRARGLRVEAITQPIYGERRDAVLARSRLALNVRFYEDGLFPTLRAAHAVANRLPVLSEKAPDSPPWSVLEDDYEALAERAAFLVRSPRNLELYSSLALELFQRCPMMLPDETGSPTARTG